MSEFFLELFSEEIPPKLQIDARENIKKIFIENFKKKNIQYKSFSSFSTPRRLVFIADGIPEKIEQKEKVIKGPKIDAPSIALEGFLNSNGLSKSDVYVKDIEKGKFYFAKIKSKTINVFEELSSIVPNVLQSYSWKKAMKWSNYQLDWGRPLKSIVALFNNKLVSFNFYHLKSTDLIFRDEMMEEKQIKVKNFKSYLNQLKLNNIILDQAKRRNIIISKFNKICNSRKLKNNFNEKLVEEVSNLVSNPNILIGKFDKIFLKIPKEILVVTMQQHQKYFPLFNHDNSLTNYFLIVTNSLDKKGYIKIGNER